MDESTRIIFLHMPKTGGTTLESYFKDVFPVDSRFCESDTGLGRYEVTKSLERAAMYLSYDKLSCCFHEFLDDRDYYSGHICYGFHAGLRPRPYRYVTVIRDPIKRLISYLNTVYTISRDQVSCYQDWVNLCLESGKFYEMDNYQTRCLLADGWLANPTWGSLDAERYNLAVSTLEKEFVFGVTEHIPLLIKRIKLELGLDLSEEARMLNVTKEGSEVKGYPENRFELMPLTDEDMADIHSHHEWDLKLYNFAKNRALELANG